MLLETIIRGNVVEFTVTFLDANGDVVEPASAEMKVNFLNSENARETVSVDMEEASDGTWSTEWDSSDALPSRVFWSALSTSPASAKDGAFELAANRANLGIVE